MRSIYSDYFCHSCRHIWQGSTLSDKEPLEVAIDLQDQVSSLNCYHCNTVGKLELMSIEDEQQLELPVPKLIKTLLSRLRYHFIKQQFGAREPNIAVTSLLDNSYDGTPLVGQGESQLLTVTMRAMYGKVSGIYADGKDSMVKELGTLLDSSYFFGLPIIGYSIDDSNENYSILTAVPNEY